MCAPACKGAHIGDAHKTLVVKCLFDEKPKI